MTNDDNFSFFNFYWMWNCDNRMFSSIHNSSKTFKGWKSKPTQFIVSSIQSPHRHSYVHHLHWQLL